MKRLITTDITTTIGFPPKAGTWDFLQDAAKENDEQIMITSIFTIMGYGNSFGYSLSIPYVLYGGQYNSGSGTVAQCAILFNGEIYTAPTTVVAPTIYAHVVITNYTTNADPVTFTDGNPYNVHNIRKIVWNNTSAGALFAYTAVNFLRVAKTIPATFTNGSADATNPIKYSRIGTIVNIQGVIYNAVSATIFADYPIFTLPVASRPLQTIVKLCPDVFTPAIVPLQILSTGVVSLRGDLVNFDNNNVYIDVSFDIA